MDIIHSPRLELIAMSPDFLEASLGDDLESASQLINLAIPAEWLEAKWLMEMRLESKMFFYEKYKKCLIWHRATGK